MKLLLLSLFLLLGKFTLNSALPQVTSGPNYTKLSAEHIHHLQSKGFGPTVPTPFRASQSLVANDDDDDNEEEDEDISPAQSQARRPIYGDDYNIPNVIPVQVRPVQRLQPQHQHQPQPQIYRRPVQPQYVQQQQQPIYSKGQSKDKSKVEEEIEEDEPDRLSLLLPNSKFDCTSKNTGYYADEDLQCEVFHYCQDNAKHSWICPEGFTFHQVHLICMPPGADNICAKSSQFHFVNEYLYKPLNLEEHQRKPNISLKYSDRYYPENYFNHNSYEDDDEEEDERQQYHHQRKPVRVGLQQAAPQHQVLQVVRSSSNLRAASTETSGQVFRSPEEVNISLQQRKPQYVTQRYREEFGI